MDSLLRILAAVLLAWFGVSPLAALASQPDQLLQAVQLAQLGQQANVPSERILLFDADISVRPDGRLDVTETLTVNCLGQQVKRGIVRELPTSEHLIGGGTRQVEYRITDVRRDGRPEPYHLEGGYDLLKIYVGSKDVFIPNGLHTFVISYVTDPQVRFLAQVDEIYWNVTGNQWRLPIDKARARVQLPPGGTVQQSAAYTGPRGAKGQAYLESRPEREVAVFETSAPLESGEGLTIAVGWPKGILNEPTPAAQAMNALLDNMSLFSALLGLGITLGYYVIAWLMVGRDPAKGTIIPLYAPPAGIDAPGARYLSRMGFDGKTLAVAVVQMAVQGRLKMIQTGDEYTLSRKLTAPGKPDAPGDDVEQALFAEGGLMDVKQENHTQLAKAQKALKDSLAGRFKGELFKANLGWFLPGVAYLLLTLAGVVHGGHNRESLLFMLFWLVIWSAGCVMLLNLAAKRWHRALHGGRGRVTVWLGALFITAFSLPFLAGEITGMVLLGAQTGFLTLGLLTAQVAAVAVFHHLLKAPTLEGRRLMDAIEGFKMYLGVAEADRMNLLNPPERTPQLFEAYLPFAMALDVEQQWGEQFADVLAASTMDGQNYSPVWYSGSSWSTDTPSDFTTDLGSAFSDAMTSSSSSASGGGGSSGGGGGGGGGGGW